MNRPKYTEEFLAVIFFYFGRHIHCDGVIMFYWSSKTFSKVNGSDSGDAGNCLFFYRYSLLPCNAYFKS